MSTFGGQNVALCASPAVVDVVVIGVVTEAVLAKSTVVV
jgi:acetylornithine/succinyldiaminopimelate/putrescine aminotransferase